MNYLLSLAHLLKWLFCPAPKLGIVGVVDAVAVPRNGQDWEKRVQMSADEEQQGVDVTTTTAVSDVAELQILQDISPDLANEAEIPSAVEVIAVKPVFETAVLELTEKKVAESIISDPAPLPLKDESLQRPSGWITVQLQQQVTLANLQELQQELQQLLGKRVQLSGSQVQRVDTAALQLLVAFMHSSEVSVCWIDHSPALRQAAHLLGLSTLLNLPE